MAFWYRYDATAAIAAQAQLHRYNMNYMIMK